MADDYPQLDVIAVGAHPDDVEIACGGTLASLARQGVSVGIVDLTDIGKFVPNLNITGFSAGHTSSQNPFIRGIGLQDHLITTEPGVGASTCASGSHACTGTRPTFVP